MTQINPTLIEKAAIGLVEHAYNAAKDHHHNGDAKYWDSLYRGMRLKKQYDNQAQAALTSAIGEPVVDLKDLNASIAYYNEHGIVPNDQVLINCAAQYRALFADGADKSAGGGNG